MNEIDVPWYFKSPNPVTILIWIIFTLWASRILFQRVTYKKWARFNSLLDAALIVAFTTVILDTMWCVACAIKFGPMFPQDLDQILFSLARDVAAIPFFYLMIGKYFQTKTLNLNKSFWIGLTANALFLSIWFSLAQDPSLTDFTFAIKHGYPQSTILQAFLFSHILGRIIYAWIFFSIFQNHHIEFNSTNPFKEKC